MKNIRIIAVCFASWLMNVSALLKHWLGAGVGGLTVYCMPTVPGKPELNGARCRLQQT